MATYTGAQAYIKTVLLNFTTASANQTIYTCPANTEAHVLIQNFGDGTLSVSGSGPTYIVASQNGFDCFSSGVAPTQGPLEIILLPGQTLKNNAAPSSLFVIYGVVKEYNRVA